ncbi:MAG TPA: glycosyltransferase family 4 protein [Bryobacteraceae bacterium]|nr:glycosyltransferase family 4 protein [Bryobacteraceae bacterium]
MNVLHLISSEGFYGAESMLVSLASASAQYGCTCHVGVFRHLQSPHTEVAARAEVLGLSTCLIDCKGRFDFGAVQQIRRIVVDRQIDVIHAHGYKADLFAYLAAFRVDVTLVSTCHNWPDRRFSMRAYAALDRLFLRQFDWITTPSPEVAEILKHSGVHAARVTFVRNGVDTARFRPGLPDRRAELGCDGNSFVVGFVGRLVEAKGGHVLVEAFKAVDANRPTKLLFIGDGSELDNLRDLAQSLGLSDRVIFAGRQEDMPSVYASIDVLALPSFTEAMPMTLLEGMACGVPAIATSVGAVPSMVRDGISGFLVKVGDSASLAAAITSLANDTTKAARFGRNSRALIEDNFSVTEMARQYTSLYRKAMNQKRAGLATWRPTRSS